ncbi:MAG: hypothetical protein HYZ58_14990 [Acidobacteria bacterium]|nr:hypothetical protein [Acidobacteriota bacterium]
MIRRLCVSGALTLIVALALTGAALQADPLACNLGGYKAQQGLTAVVEQDTLALTWEGDKGSELRMRLGIDAGRPTVRELAVRQKSGQWRALGRNLTPEFNVTSGKRRIGGDQVATFQALGVDLTPEVIEREKWNAFWDAPLVIPGMVIGAAGSGGSAAQLPGIDLPRKPDEIRRAAATFNANACTVKTDGARLEVSFPGVSVGVFSGRLQYTVYKGTNLVRQEVIAKTEDPSVAYQYSGGLKGFSTASQRVRWRDTGGDWQKYEFGGSPNENPVPLRARNRIAIVEGQGGSVAVFPPPHKFFFSREIEINLGYVYYRKHDEQSFSVGVRHSENEEVYKPIGPNAERMFQGALRFAEGNFALYNAPPGTWQRMAVYFYLSSEGGNATNDAVLVFTNGDRYRPLPGYQTMMTHLHSPFTKELLAEGSLDNQMPWIPAIRARGVNIIHFSDFHGDPDMRDPGPKRLASQQKYFEASRRHSDKEFLILPFEEPWDYLLPPAGGEGANSAFGSGHWNTFFPRPVYWTQKRQPGQPLVEQHPEYGTVYHVGSQEDLLELMKRENGFFYLAHQRTKGTSGLLDLKVQHQPYFRTDHFLGGEYRANVPTDLSQKRMLEWPGLDAMDDMNNWTARTGLQPKYLVAATDTYMKWPEDDIYPSTFVNYVKVDRLPKFDEGWASIVRAMKGGQFFVSSGEVLIKQFAVEGAGARRTIAAEFDCGSKRFSLPFDASGKDWVRVAAWDSAGNGTFSQPIRLAAPTTTTSR